MPATKALEGGCHCGAIRYTLRAAPMFVHCCHCKDCQKQTGGAFAINALVEAANLPLLKGTPERIAMPTESGRPHDVYRCPKCLTAVWSDYGRRGVLRFVRVGTLDDPSALKPDVHIFTRSKQPWVGLPADVPAFEIYYDMKALWPKESLERRAAILGGR